MRRAEDDLPDRRGLVEHVAHARRQSRLIECGGAEQTNLLFRREEQLDSRMRTVLCENATRRIEHRRNRRLVVGSEDRVGGIEDHAVVDDGLDRASRRHRVQVRAEEERRAAVCRRLDSGEEVADRRSDPRAGVVLVGFEPELAQVTEDGVGDGSLFARRARKRGQLEEEIEYVGRHARPIL